MKRILFYGCTIALQFLVLLALYTFWQQHKQVVFPTTVNLYVLDTRQAGDFSSDLQKLFSSLQQRLAGLRIIVVPVDPREVSSFEDQWRTMLDRPVNVASSQMLFFKLDPLSTSSNKQLRFELEKRFNMAERTAILRRTVALARVRGDNPLQACNKLEQDWVYMKWNFNSIALVVDDNTLALIESCLANILTKTLAAP